MFCFIVIGKSDLVHNFKNKSPRQTRILPQVSLQMYATNSLHRLTQIILRRKGWVDYKHPVMKYCSMNFERQFPFVKVVSFQKPVHECIKPVVST